MSKKGYKRELPAILPPTLPAPRGSSEPITPTRAGTPHQWAVVGPRTGRPHSWESVVEVVAIALLNVATIGLLVFSMVGVLANPSTPPGPDDGGATGATGAIGGPALAANESYVETRVLSNGDVVVRQWIQAAQPLEQIRLAVPTVTGAEDLSATMVRVTADGERVAGPARIAGRGATYTFDRATDVQVRYRLTGAVERSTSVDGRALAVATTLDVSYTPQAERETRVVRALEVLSLACSQSPQESPVPCGEATGADQWQVELTSPRAVDRVVAQLTIG